MRKLLASNYQRCSLMAGLVLMLPYTAKAQIKVKFIDYTGIIAGGGSFKDLLLAILNIVIVIAIPIIVLFIIYAGFMYVTARGNASQLEQATRTLTYAIIGGVLILGAVTLGGIIGNVVDSFTAP
jgi:hypothetical protein